MKEELQTALADLISKTLQGVGAGRDFLTAEIPDVIGQLLMWHGWFSFVEFIFGLVLVCSGAYALYRVLSNKDNIDWYEENLNMVKGIVCIAVSAIAPLVSLFYINFTWLQIWIAPKVWLIEYMGRLVNK